MRLNIPSRRWYRKWVENHKNSGGWTGPATLKALWPYAVELYRAGATATAAGLATAKEYDRHSSRQGWAELAGASS